jgi:hypothetical protein
MNLVFGAVFHFCDEFSCVSTVDALRILWKTRMKF